MLIQNGWLEFCPKVPGEEKDGASKGPRAGPCQRPDDVSRIFDREDVGELDNVPLSSGNCTHSRSKAKGIDQVLTKESPDFQDVNRLAHCLHNSLTLVFLRVGYPEGEPVLLFVDVD